MIVKTSIILQIFCLFAILFYCKFSKERFAFFALVAASSFFLYFIVRLFMSSVSADDLIVMAISIELSRFLVIRLFARYGRILASSALFTWAQSILPMLILDISRHSQSLIDYDRTLFASSYLLASLSIGFRYRNVISSGGTGLPGLAFGVAMTYCIMLIDVGIFKSYGVSASVLAFLFSFFVLLIFYLSQLIKVRAIK